MPDNRMEQRVRRASLIVAIGLIIQAFTAIIVHPLAFVAFLTVGCPVMVAGVLYFLLGLVSAPEAGESSHEG